MINNNLKFIILILLLGLFESNVKSQGYIYLLNKPELNEISGMIGVKVETPRGSKYDNDIWALSDGGAGAKLFKLNLFDSAFGAQFAQPIAQPIEINSIASVTTFANASNVDWEELCRDDSFVYIGDFGNNNGTRKNLCIYKFSLSKLGQQNVIVDTIGFNYGEQKDFSSRLIHNFDCEAMVCEGNNLVLFTKGQGNNYSYRYKIPKQKGNYTVFAQDSAYTTHLITGAAKHALDSFSGPNYVLVGYTYTSSLKLKSDYTRVYWKEDINNWQRTSYTDYGNGQDYSVNSQTESVLLNLVSPVISLVFSAEKNDVFPAHIYFWNQPEGVNNLAPLTNVKIFPNPGQELQIQLENECTVAIFDQNGRLVHQQFVEPGLRNIETTELATGNYQIKVYAPGYQIWSSNWMKN